MAPRMDSSSDLACQRGVQDLQEGHSISWRLFVSGQEVEEPLGCAGRATDVEVMEKN